MKRVFIFEGITETNAEKFVVHIRHIHVNLTRKELDLSFYVEHLMVNNIPVMIQISELQGFLSLRKIVFTL